MNHRKSKPILLQLQCLQSNQHIKYKSFLALLLSTSIFRFLRDFYILNGFLWLVFTSSRSTTIFISSIHSDCNAAVCLDNRQECTTVFFQPVNIDYYCLLKILENKTKYIISLLLFFLNKIKIIAN